MKTRIFLNGNFLLSLHQRLVENDGLKTRIFDERPKLPMLSWSHFMTMCLPSVGVLPSWWIWWVFDICTRSRSLIRRVF